MMEVSNNAVDKHRVSIHRMRRWFHYRRKKTNKGFIVLTVAGLAFFTVFIGIDRIVYLFEPEIVTTSTASAQLDSSKPTQLISNAFKLGHGLTQMRYAETNDHQYIKWKNRMIVHLVALGIDISVIHEAIDDCKLTLDETIVLRDQIREKIKNFMVSRLPQPSC